MKNYEVFIFLLPSELYNKSETELCYIFLHNGLKSQTHLPSLCFPEISSVLEGISAIRVTSSKYPVF